MPLSPGDHQTLCKRYVRGGNVWYSDKTNHGKWCREKWLPPIFETMKAPGKHLGGRFIGRCDYAPSISRRDSTRSIKGLMPSSLDMARDSSSKEMALARSLSASRSLSMSA